MKLTEGLFEGVPQSLLQTYKVVDDMFDGKVVDNALGFSILLSFVTIGMSLTTLQRKAQIQWRVPFFLYTMASAMVRTLTVGFLG